MSGEKWKKKRGVAEKRIERSCENKCQAIATKTAGNKTNHERTIAARRNHNIDTLVHISMQCNSQRLVANSCRPRVLIRNSFPPSHVHFGCASARNARTQAHQSQTDRFTELLHIYIHAIFKSTFLFLLVVASFPHKSSLLRVRSKKTQKKKGIVFP